MKYEKHLIETVADEWVDLRLRCQRGEDLSSEDVAEALLAAIDASGVAWVAPRVPTAAMMLEFAHGMGEQWGDYIVMRDACLAERRADDGDEPKGGDA